MSSPPPQDIEEALRAVSVFERALCGWCVRRQLTVRLRAPQEVERYGLEGAVKLAVGRCFLLYGLILGIASTVLAAAGSGGDSLVVHLALLVVLAWAGFRVASAGRAGRKRRAVQRST
jgi:hypothetical protein